MNKYLLVDTARQGKEMAEYFYVSREADRDGSHQVHKRSCRQMPNKLKFVGVFDDPRKAIADARLIFAKLSGCPVCGTELNISRDRANHFNRHIKQNVSKRSPKAN